MTITVTAQLQLRKGTAAQWTSANPVLLSGEVGYETDTGKQKIGDGATAWASLAYYHDPVLVTDHGGLTGLSDDDHSQYHNDTRGDARYSLLAHDHAATYAPIAKGVTNGDSHDHSGGDGAQISYSTLSNLPTLGTAAATAATDYAAAAHNHTGVYEASGAVSTHAALTTTHGISSFGASLVDDADAGTARTTLGLGTAATTASTDYAAASHTHAASAIASGTIDTARLGSGTANSSTYLRGDQTWAAASGGMAADTHAATDKATPVDADELPLVDSAASYILKKLTWANLKATLQSVFAVLAGNSGGQTLIGGTGVTDKLVLQGTSGNGTSTAVALEMKVGNNGGTTALTVNNSGISSFREATVVNGHISIIIGADNAAYTLTNATNKTARFAYAHYNTAEEPICIFNGGSNSSENYLSFGGGTAILNAATRVSFYTTPAINTMFGTERVRINSSGDTGFGNVAPSARIHATSTTEQLRLGYDASYYASFTVSSAGNLTITNTGTTIYTNKVIENTVAGAGIVLKSPDGTRYLITVANGGTLTVATA
jgi:hypothetical protein